MFLNVLRLLRVCFRRHCAKECLMKTSMCAAFAFTSMAALTVPVLAQQDDTRTGIPVHILDASGGTYHDRATGIPFDLWTNANSSGLFRFLAQGTGKHILEDINFAPGPWGSQATRVIDAIDFSVWGDVLGQF